MEGYATDSNASSARSGSYSPSRRARPESRFATGASVKNNHVLEKSRNEKAESFQDSEDFTALLATFSSMLIVEHHFQLQS